MKAKITNITYKNGNEESILFTNANISFNTYYGLQRKEPNALRNLKRVLKECILEGYSKDVKEVTLKIKNYPNLYVDLEEYKTYW